jgi:predicted DNA-binding protein
MSDNLDKRISIRLSDELYKKIEERAEELGVGVATIVRQSLSENMTDMDSELKENEEWVPRYEGDYSVTKNGTVISHKFGHRKELEQNRNVNGYYCVSLYKNDKGHVESVHKLVLEAFKGKAPKDHECRHLNGDKLDNRLENLEWGTHEENVEDRHRNGNWTALKGEENPHAKLTEEEVEEIRKRYDSEDVSQPDLGDEFGVGHSVISDIVRGERWEHVRGPIQD